MIELERPSIALNAVWEFFKSGRGINCIGTKIGSQRWVFFAWEKENFTPQLRNAILKQWGIETAIGPALDRKASVEAEKPVLWDEERQTDYSGLYVKEDDYDTAHVSALSLKPNK